MKLNDSDMNIIEKKFQEYKALSFSELSKLPGNSTTKLQLSSQEVDCTVWVDVTSESKVRVVLQLDRGSFFGITSLIAKGFSKNSDNEIVDLEWNELGL